MLLPNNSDPRVCHFLCSAINLFISIFFAGYLQCLQLEICCFIHADLQITPKMKSTFIASLTRMNTIDIKHFCYYFCIKQERKRPFCYDQWSFLILLKRHGITSPSAIASQIQPGLILVLVHKIASSILLSIKVSFQSGSSLSSNLIALI